VRAIPLVLTALLTAAAQENTPEKLIQAGHWKRARTLVDQRLREQPDDANAVFLSSQIRNAFGDHSSPLGLAERAVRLDGGVARYHRQLAEVLGVTAQHAGMFQQVMLARRFRKEVDTALELDPMDLQAERDLFEFYLLAPGILGGDLKKAEASAQRIATLDTAEGYLAEARIAEYSKDAQKTEAMLRRAAEARPGSYKALMALAWFYLAPEPRHNEAAEAVAKEALKLESGRAAAYGALASIYAEQGKWDALEETLANAQEAVPDDRTPYYRAAEQLIASGRDAARAGRYLRFYLEQEPEGNEPAAADANAKLRLATGEKRRSPANTPSAGAK
jgi:tetratricopeptide (TPR) repeat protein